MWSADQRERRIGTFSDFYGSIFLRERTECREVPKYWHLDPRWVLERLTFLPPSSSVHRELISQGSIVDPQAPVLNGTYEPIYVFQDGGGNELPVTEWAIEAILHTAEFGERKKLSDSDMRDDYFKEIEDDARYFEEVLQEQGRSALFAFENSVFVDSKKVYKESLPNAPAF